MCAYTQQMVAPEFPMKNAINAKLKQFVVVFSWRRANPVSLVFYFNSLKFLMKRLKLELWMVGQCEWMTSTPEMIISAEIRWGTLELTSFCELP